jgi:hypothetical protein
MRVANGANGVRRADTCKEPYYGGEQLPEWPLGLRLRRQPPLWMALTMSFQQQHERNTD